MARVFFNVQGFIVYSLMCWCEWTRKILCFFNMVFNFFFDDLIIIENQFILISYEKIGLKEKESK